ncbi:MAG: hypothetical protein H0X64_04240 [Gemmatimonadaceae bacterium]|nr:hypothetical protein [Gemmatimonadaceae bacterium]
MIAPLVDQPHTMDGAGDPLVDTQRDGSEAIGKARRQRDRCFLGGSKITQAPLIVRMVGLPPSVDELIAPTEQQARRRPRVGRKGSGPESSTVVGGFHSRLPRCDPDYIRC